MPSYSVICAFSTTCLIYLVILIVLNFTKIKKVVRLVLMWIFTLFLPMFVFVSMAGMLSDSRPYPKNTLENMLGVELPDYNVIHYEEYCPGGDDWKKYCIMKINDDVDISKLEKKLEENVTTRSHYVNEYSDVVIWRKEGDCYKFRLEYHIESSIEFIFNVSNRTIEYTDWKI